MQLLSCATCRSNIFRVGFNTGFIEANNVLQFGKEELDDGYRNKRLADDFRLEAVFEPVLDDAKSEPLPYESILKMRMQQQKASSTAADGKAPQKSIASGDSAKTDKLMEFLTADSASVRLSTVIGASAPAALAGVSEAKSVQSDHDSSASALVRSRMNTSPLGEIADNPELVRLLTSLNLATSIPRFLAQNVSYDDLRLLGTEDLCALVPDPEERARLSSFVAKQWKKS